VQVPHRSWHDSLQGQACPIPTKSDYANSLHNDYAKTLHNDYAKYLHNYYAKSLHNDTYAEGMLT
jgi:hypothetical protein